MSWIYSIVFAGLLFSSNSQSGAIVNNNHVAIQPSAVTQDETEKFEQSYPLNPNGRVCVSNVNGSIVVEAWERNEVHLVAVKTADSKEALADVEIKVDARPDYFSVEAAYDSWKQNGDRGWKNHRKLEVQFKLQVPRGAVLNEVETVNGSVTVANFVNYTKVSAVNGNVTATNLRGAANLSTVNGEVVADFDRLEDGSKITLSTVNGRVNLQIPSDANATIKADSLNGNITNDFGLPVRKGQYVGRDLYGRVGTGAVNIKLDSVNGPLSIGRKNDGKSVKPATNLLPQKKSDEDWDDDTDDERGAAKTAKSGKTVARAVRRSQQQSAESMKETGKVLEKVKPELDKIKIDGEKFKIQNLEQVQSQIDAESLQNAIASGIAQAGLVSRLRDVTWPGPVIQKKSKSFPVKGTPRVTVEAKGCNVRIRGWDKAEVQYTVTEIARRRDREPVSINEDMRGSDITLRVTNPGTDRGSLPGVEDLDRVRIEVFVPRKSNLRVTTNGEIRLDGVSGDIQLKGEDESINVRDTEGKLTLAAHDSQIRVIGFSGDLDSQTVDGDVYLEGDFRKLAAKAGDGTIYLTLPEDANASLYSNTDVGSEGVDLSHEDGKPWIVGKGGTKYNFTFAEGNLVVRCAGMLTSN
jgi:hypothetical protein